MGGPFDRPASFPKASRILKRSEFLHVRDRGRSFSDGPLAVSWSRREPVPTRRCEDPAASSAARVGLVVSSKVGNSVVRSRVKRLLREAVRARLAGLPAVDLVLVARASAVQSGIDRFALCLERIGRRIDGSLRADLAAPTGREGT